MTASAIVVMILAGTVFWGGLVWSIVRLRNHPELDDPDVEDLQPGGPPSGGSRSGNPGSADPT